MKPPIPRPFPTIYACCLWANGAQELRFCQHAKRFTLEVISACLLGEENEDMLKTLMENTHIMSEAILGLPVYLPWPLSRTSLARIPILSFGRGMEARNRILEALQNVLDERRRAFSDGGRRERRGMIDAMLAMQADQQERGGAREGELLLDDAFIGDNVSFQGMI